MCVYICWRNQFRLSNNIKCSFVPAPKGTFIFIACPFNCYCWLLFSLSSYCCHCHYCRRSNWRPLQFSVFDITGSEGMSIELSLIEKCFTGARSVRVQPLGDFNTVEKNVRKSPPTSFDKIAETRLSGNFMLEPLGFFKWFRHTEITWKMTEKKNKEGKKFVEKKNNQVKLLLIVSPISSKNS